ncbi:PIR Superfamily Protein [Plasmodium ovale wallikeri]|uniref:PIR Superfamily Protein n=1 Tax=Plasmodium ovale wallikeri TaxID=864142 RepID=A0A1A9AAC1_PLAOA|nr:PIR Superfamily Protein [Plasmodium ovale wallikeri]SBT59303.1 PIR Superfamily Protein [Plasmodium ovale wallikeri]
MSDTEPDIVCYSFFESFKEYKTREAEMKVIFSRNTNNPTCETHSWGSKKFGNDSAINICIQFKILCDVIQNRKEPRNRSNIDDKDFAYLNYWLNGHSRNTTSSNSVTFKEFQMNMDLVEDIFITVPLNGKLYDLEEDDFQNMKLLDYLHSNYFGNVTKISDLTEEKNISCFKHVKELLNTYKRGIIQCHIDNTNFCKALKHFEKEYNKIFFTEDSITDKCTDQELLKLPTYDDVSLEEKNISVVGSILGPSFGTLFTMLILYKFTPIGQWINSKIGKNIETQSILCDENDESLLNISDSEHINFCDNSYLISYDSVVNS